MIKKVRERGSFMKKSFITVMALGLVFGLILTGCGAKKAGSSREAISAAKTMETSKEKVDYLVGQAKAFYNSKEFQNAIDTAQYVLRYLDRDSQPAKDLLQKAKDALTAQAKSAVEDAKKKISGFGK